MKNNIKDSVVFGADYSKYTEKQRDEIIGRLCEAYGLNRDTQPFVFMPAGRTLILHATRACAEQLRRNYALSTRIIEHQQQDDVYVVWSEVSDGTRTEQALGAQLIKCTEKKDGRADARMAAQTKAVRRATLAFCGLGMLDEEEAKTLATQSVEPPSQEVGEGVTVFDVLSELLLDLPAKRQNDKDAKAAAAAIAAGDVSKCQRAIKYFQKLKKEEEDEITNAN